MNLVNEHTTAFKRLDLIILSIVLFLALLCRLYNLGVPLADYHSWRQADTAAIARNFVRDGFDLMHPHYDDLSSIQSGIENPKGLRFVEFPIYNATFALLYKYFPVISLEIYGRLTTAAFSLFIIAIIYYLVLKEQNRLSALIAALIYSVFPFFVFSSRVILPETTALSFAFISIFLLYKFSFQNKNKWKSIYYISSVISFAVALLVKPTAVFYAIPLLFLFIRTYEFSSIKKIHMYLFFILAAIPLVLWRQYILQFPEGIPVSAWLITSVNTSEGLKNVFFKPAFFRWIFFERINNIIFGGFASGFFLLGLVIKTKRYFLYSIFVAAFTYLFVFQGGNVQHEYYQTLILPALAIFAGVGTASIILNTKSFISPYISIVVIIIAYILSIAFSAYKMVDFYRIPQDLVQVAQIVKTFTKEDDKIVTDRLGDTTLLYLSDRKGSPAIYTDPESFKSMGYSYLVTQHKDTAADLLKKYKLQVVFENDKFTMFKL